MSACTYSQVSPSVSLHDILLTFFPKALFQDSRPPSSYNLVRPLPLFICYPPPLTHLSVDLIKTRLQQGDATLR